MSTRRSPLVVGMVAVLLIGIGVTMSLCVRTRQSRDLLLSDYPKLFEDNAMIVVGANASQMELDSAEAIAANLEQLTRNRPVTKKDGEVSQNDKSHHSLILVGTPNSNSLLQEAYDATNATRLTKEYPGENKGILQILRNPWNHELATLLLAGSDERGVRAGSEIIRHVQDIRKVSVAVEWNGVGGAFASTIPVDRYVFIEFLQEISGAPVRIDYPAVYHFDDASGVFEGGGFEINASLTMLIGHRLAVQEPGGGEGGGVIPLYSLPSTVNIPLSWEIVYIDGGGTVYLRYGDAKAMLGSGEECEREFRAEWMGWEVLYKVKIKNHGFQDKNKIRPWSTGG